MNGVTSLSGMLLDDEEIPGWALKKRCSSLFLKAGGAKMNER